MTGFIEEIKLLRVLLQQADDGLLTAQEQFESEPSHDMPKTLEALAFLSLMAAHSTIVRSVRRLGILIDNLEAAEISTDLTPLADSLKRD